MPAIPFYDPDTNGFVYHVQPDVHTFYAESVSEMTSETESSESVKEMLPPDPGRTYHALELGTRDGTWIQEMATEFPHVHFRSLDVAPIIAHAPRANIMFEVYDFSAELLLDDSSQDIVFLNAVFELVKDYRALIREVYRVLRPGGLIHIRDFDIVIYDSQNPSQLARRTHPIACQLLDIMQEGLAGMGVDPRTFERLPGWLASEPNGEPGFENVQSVAKMFPVYPHESAICSHKVDPRIAPYLEHFTVMSFRDFTSILCDATMEDHEAETLIEGAIEEVRRPGNCGLMKLICMYAVKKVS
ncbi:hypothetical protein FRC07_006481 [Ceratobasidium sp. 392]|nr:hypothetical protein FRC07_006481 [Ceratobasidium sp. 392]